MNHFRPMERFIPFYATRGLILKTVVGVLFPADVVMQVIRCRPATNLQLIYSCPESMSALIPQANLHQIYR